MCDFEQTIHMAVRDQSPSAYIVGCLFHWKQAIRRKVLELRIPKGDVQVAMTPGLLDTLTVVPEAGIRTKGIPFVTHSLNSRVDKQKNKGKWNSFWTYFTRTWMSAYPESCWNISVMLSDNVEIVNRTNNPLECYNRLVAERCGVAHPILLAFVETLKEESLSYVTLLDDIRHKRQEPPRHAQEIRYPYVPALYDPGRQSFILHTVLHSSHSINSNTHG